MNSIIDWLNQHGATATSYALQVLWQSSLLILVLAAVDRLIRNRARATVRYALWMLLPVKLLLPPSLLVPGSFAYWIPQRVEARRSVPVVAPKTDLGPRTALEQEQPQPVTQPTAPFNTSPADATPLASLESPTSHVALNGNAWLCLAWMAVAIALLARVVSRGLAVARIRQTSSEAAPAIWDCLDECRRQLGVRRSVVVKLCAGVGSPALCGLFRPAILIPRGLAERLSREQLRTILLHELAHLQRRDLEANLLQILLQVAYWWHPLLWAANSHIRRLREQAVDEVVAVETAPDESTYAETLLAVARFATTRLPLSPGFLGVIEPGTVMRDRVERLLTWTRPRTRRLGHWNALCLVVLGFLLLPMTGAKSPPPVPIATTSGEGVQKFTEAPFWVRFFMVRTNDDFSSWGLRQPPRLIGSNYVWIISKDESMAVFDKIAKTPNLQSSDLDPCFKFLGGKFRFYPVTHQPTQADFSWSWKRNVGYHVRGAGVQLWMDQVGVPKETPGFIGFTATQRTLGPTNTFEIEWQKWEETSIPSFMELPEGGAALIMEASSPLKGTGEGLGQAVIFATTAHPFVKSPLPQVRPPPLWELEAVNLEHSTTNGSEQFHITTRKVHPEEFLGSIRAMLAHQEKSLEGVAYLRSNPKWVRTPASYSSIASNRSDNELVCRFLNEVGPVGVDPIPPPPPAALLYFPDGKILLRTTHAGMDRFSRTLARLDLNTARMAVNGVFIEADADWLGQLQLGQPWESLTPETGLWLIADTEAQHIIDKAKASSSAKVVLRHNLLLHHGTQGWRDYDPGLGVRMGGAYREINILGTPTPPSHAPEGGETIIMNRRKNDSRCRLSAFARFDPQGMYVSGSAEVNQFAPREEGTVAKPDFAAAFRLVVPEGMSFALMRKNPNQTDSLVIISPGVGGLNQSLFSNNRK